MSTHIRVGPTQLSPAALSTGHRHVPWFIFSTSISAMFQRSSICQSAMIRLETELIQVVHTAAPHLKYFPAGNPERHLHELKQVLRRFLFATSDHQERKSLRAPPGGFPVTSSLGHCQPILLSRLQYPSPEWAPLSVFSRCTSCGLRTRESSPCTSQLPPCRDRFPPRSPVKHSRQ